MKKAIAIAAVVGSGRTRDVVRQLLVIAANDDPFIANYRPSPVYIFEQKGTGTASTGSASGGYPIPKWAVAQLGQLDDALAQVGVFAQGGVQVCGLRWFDGDLDRDFDGGLDGGVDGGRGDDEGRSRVRVEEIQDAEVG